MKKKPCNECPFRRKSLRGYLGPHKESSEIIGLLVVGVKFPCHQQVNSIADHLRHDREPEDDPIDRSEAVEVALSEAPHCVGALQMMNNSCMLSRNRKIADQQEQVGTNKDVFFHQGEFTDWHDDPKYAKIRLKVLRESK